MAKSTAVVKKTAKRVLSAKQKEVQEVLQITWVLKGDLKRAQMLYLRIGATLADVRDRKLYERLGLSSLEEYAKKRVKLGKTSLYKYLNVYAWVAKRHSEWLGPKPEGFIPDFSDINDLIWIEEALTNKELSAQTKTELQALQAKALDGQLRQGELGKWRKQGGRSSNGLKSFLSKVRLLRVNGVEIKEMPSEAIAYLDAIIEVVQKAMVARKST